MTANEQLVARLLADPDPQIKVASEHPELRKRIRIFLDGEDVTSLCRGFSIPGRRVDLYPRENGRLLLDWTCGCGTVRGTKRPASFSDWQWLEAIGAATIFLVVLIETRFMWKRWP